jgi:hypothetical protein
MWKGLTILLLISPITDYAPPGGALGRITPENAIACAPPANTITCAPSTPASITPDADGRYAPVFPGWGHYHYPITTSDDSAQFYFDQGLSLYYSYHLTESAASFREAQLKDSRCAMAFWGEALALGPYYNSTYFYKMPPEVLPVIAKMNALVPASSQKEKALILALNHRYSSDTTDSHRTQLNHDWSQAAHALVLQYPDDNDIKALYIDGVMTEHAWDLWDTEGKPRSWTPELVDYCEAILKNNPDHPAALHYHIHLLEASLHPEPTLPSADRLKDLMPGVAHMTHMASHSYQRTGHYDKGVAINDSANAALKNYSVLAPQLRLNSTVTHYDAVEAFCAMNGGMYHKAIQSALKCQTAIASRPGTPKPNVQYLAMFPDFVLVRLGKWQEILDRPLPDSSWAYARVISYFARGMAYIRTGNQSAANACLDSLRKNKRDPSLTQHILPFNEAIKGTDVAEDILAAEIFAARKANGSAAAAFDRAMIAEDGMSYLEPKDWPLPVRHFAAAWLLRIGKPAKAENLYREDLDQNPGIGWSLLGLAQSLEAQHKTPDYAADYRARAKAAFAQAEQMPPASAW